MWKYVKWTVKVLIYAFWSIIIFLANEVFCFWSICNFKLFLSGDRYGVIQVEPLWIVFPSNMMIKLKQELIFNSYKTLDGRGANVHIVGGGCITLQYISNVIIHNIHIHHCYQSGNFLLLSYELRPVIVYHKRIYFLSKDSYWPDQSILVGPFWCTYFPSRSVMFPHANK